MASKILLVDYLLVIILEGHLGQTAS